jgi:hypothetical protein
MLANDGWRLLPLYEYNPANALWRHRDGLPKPPASLRNVEFGSPFEAPSTLPIEVLQDHLTAAAEILAQEFEVPPPPSPLSTAAEELRWFPNPVEAVR